MTPASSVAAGVGIAGVLLGDAAGIEPWWIAALLLPLAGFCGWMVRWILSKQDEREKAIAERENNREKREDRRAEQAELQTIAMRECVAELRELNVQQSQHTQAIADVPRRVAELIGDRKAS